MWRASGSAPRGPSWGVVDGFSVDFGDVNDEGRDEALVQITCAAGAGSNAWTNTVVLESGPGAVAQLGQPIPAFTAYVDGELIGEERYYEDGDAMCCPSKMLQSRWILRNGGWSQEQTTAVPASESIAGNG